MGVNILSLYNYIIIIIVVVVVVVVINYYILSEFAPLGAYGLSISEGGGCGLYDLA